MTEEMRVKFKLRPRISLPVIHGEATNLNNRLKYRQILSRLVKLIDSWPIFLEYIPDAYLHNFVIDKTRREVSRLYKLKNAGQLNHQGILTRIISRS